MQIAKRHRDIMFVDDPDVAPLSVIITTLASRSYEWCVTNREYDNELDLLFDVIRHMPDTIEMCHVDGRDQWFIWNETTGDENFAEKWNRRPERAEAFFTWHARFCSDLVQPRSDQRPRPLGRHPEEFVRFTSGERRDRRSDRARLDGASCRQPPASRPRLV